MSVRRMQRMDPEGAKAFLREWLCSGQRLDEYCQQVGHSYWSAKRWRLQYGEELGIEVKRRPGASSSRVTADSQAAMVVPVHIVQRQRAVATDTVEIRLTSSRSVLVPPNADVHWVARLVNAIEQSA